MLICLRKCSLNLEVNDLLMLLGFRKVVEIYFPNPLTTFERHKHYRVYLTTRGRSRLNVTWIAIR